MQAAGAAGLVIVNSEEGNKHPPGPDAIDLDMFVAMITQDEGTALIHVSSILLVYCNIFINTCIEFSTLLHTVIL
jgi:hypothetical protein